MLHAAPDSLFRVPIRMLVAIALLIAALVLLPIGSVAVSAMSPATDVLQHVLETILPEILGNTFIILIVVAGLTALIGTTTAWLVAVCRFPGRRVFTWLLLLPLAMPGFIIGYAYTDFLIFTGPVQTALRDTFGWTKSDYWFPNVHSVGGVSVVLSLVLYPYVYFIARAAFLEQSGVVLEVARTLGHSVWSCFFRIALPLARPAIVAGVALASMEALADFGTVRYFGVHTFTTAIYRVWTGFGDYAAAGQLSMILLSFVAMLLATERFARGSRRFERTGRKEAPVPGIKLAGMHAFLAIVACALPVLLGFVLPLLILLDLHWRNGDDVFGARFLGLAVNSLVLAGTGALVITLFAWIIAYASRWAHSVIASVFIRMATLGYALPGTVIAVGVLSPLASLDRSLNGIASSLAGHSFGLIFSGSVLALLFAYLVRFLSVAGHTLEAALTKVPPNLDHVARTLGCRQWQVLARVHVPLLWRSSFTAMLLVFADVLKELPATLILRPFNFDTLAVRVYHLASDERLAQASTSAIAIVLISLLPIIVLCRRMDREVLPDAVVQRF